ncbi:MAG: demethoxyubiquinone hydroxylase family protein [Hyphomonadaceae bacterium]|nr:demethoxyubiquinone hydroxylase family protein [Hyphomonadaceae bacterium]
MITAQSELCLETQRAVSRPEADWPVWVWAALRTDHAGETGAVWIYRGVLATSRDPEVRAFARAHMDTESRHLREVSAIVPAERRSRLVWLWRILGWMTGAVPGLMGRDAVFATIEAVETFVDQHYQEQIDRLRADNGDTSLTSMLDGWRQDEVAHRNDASHRRQAAPGIMLAAWTRLVSAGSAFAVTIARHV